MNKLEAIRKQVEDNLRRGWKLEECKALIGTEAQLGTHIIVCRNKRLCVRWTSYIRFAGGMVANLKEMPGRLKEMEEDRAKEFVDAL